MSKFRRYIINLIFVISSILLTLACLEGYCRWRYNKSFMLWEGENLFQLDKEYIYSLRPNTVITNTTDLFHGTLTTNSWGLRGTEIHPKNPLMKRILILGDSFTFGHGVKFSHSFPQIMQKLSEIDHKYYEIINGGVPGYGTDQEYKWFITTLYKLKPDYLIVAFCNNDIIDNMNHPLYTVKNSVLVPLDARKVWIYFLGNIYFSFPGKLRNSRLLDHILHKYENKDIFHLLPKMDYYQLQEWSENKIDLELESLDELGKKNKYKLIVIRMPDNFLVKTGKYEPGVYLESVFSTFTSCLQKNRIPYFDSNPYFTKLTSKDDLFIKGDIHLSVIGNKDLAQFSFDSIFPLIK